MKPRQDLVLSGGFCLANEGVEYYVFAPKAKEFQLFLDFPYKLQSEWINTANFKVVKKGPSVNSTTKFETPADGEDWILHVFAPKPQEVAMGNFPDLTTDTEGNIHLVYNRDGLKYRKYDIVSKKWSEEVSPGCECKGVNRSDPDIVVDSKGNPHVFCGKEYTWFKENIWQKPVQVGSRDSELAIDSKDNVYLASRGGNYGGYIGFVKKPYSSKDWTKLPDPDINNMGKNNHVYTDLWIDASDIIHLVQRHGPKVEVTYRRSDDGGKTWPVEEEVSDEREESPHIIVNSKGVPFISTGNGFILERGKNDSWKQLGRKLKVKTRMQPELGIDGQDVIYMTAFGGLFNIGDGGYWTGEKLIYPVTKNNKVGFVETSGQKDFAYVVWEEGRGNADEGLDENSKIIVGIIYPDGRIIGFPATR